ncbi:MAG: hypothetical protein ACRCTE_10230 [Cellulosilyticaceae bacterium]
MYLRELTRQEKACFLAIVKYIFEKSQLDVGYQTRLLGEYEEEMGYPRGFSADLPVPSLEAILGAVGDSTRMNRRKLFIEILGVLMFDPEIFQLQQQDMDLVALHMDVKEQEYEYFWCILTELKQTYKKMDNLLKN